MLTQGFLKVKNQAQITNLFLCYLRNQYAIVEWPLFDAPASTLNMLLLVYLTAVACITFEQWRSQGLPGWATRPPG